MIEKITDQNLERYDSRLKEWCNRKFFEKGNYGKYETTEESGAVAFYPAPNTPLEGKVKFSFKETMPANGDKGPDNPSVITGMNSITMTRVGKNLLPTTFVQTIATGITATANLDGSVSINGSTSNIIYVYFFNFSLNVNNFPNFLKKNVPYTMSFLSSSDSIYAHAYRSVNGASWDNNFTANIFNGQSDTFTIPNDTTGFLIRVTVRPGTYSNAIIKLQIEEGSIATAFEPYEENNYILSFGSTYYGGEIDLATGLMTVTHDIRNLNSSIFLSTNIFQENTNSYIVGFYPGMKSNLPNAESFACSILPTQYGNPSDDNYSCAYVKGNSVGVYIQITKTELGLGDGVSADTVRSTVKTWFGNHQGSVTFPLGTPTTVPLTPTQILSLSQTDKYTPRLNTVYTDADSVQISYLKSPIRDEYEKTQAILSLGGNS